jgi:FkbM family methyltransferase
LILANDPLAKKVALTYSGYLRRGEFDHLDLFVDPTRVSIDVGTNYGQYAMKLAIMSAGCLAIEPVKSLASIESLLPDNCVFRNVAAGRERGTKVLRIPQRDGELVEALSTMAGHVLAGYDFIDQPTEVMTVDELVRDAFPAGRIGFIKIDVEGFETEVLEGCTETLLADKPNLQVELFTHQVAPVCTYLGELGYRGLFFFEDRLVDASQFNVEVHRSPENSWCTRTSAGLEFDPYRFPMDFCFIPAT